MRSALPPGRAEEVSQPTRPSTRAAASASAASLNEPDKPLVAVCEHGASAIILIMRVWIPTDAYWEIRYKFLKEAKERFDANGISIPFDQLDVHISK